MVPSDTHSGVQGGQVRRAHTEAHPPVRHCEYRKEPPRLLLAEANDKKGGFGGIRYLDDTLSLIPTPTTAVGKRIELNPRLSGH